MIESLIKCGAFDSTHSRRSQMIASLEAALDHGQRAQKEKCDPQMTLFGGGDCPDDHQPAGHAGHRQWDDRQRLAYEKESLGFYFSGHPLNHYEELLGKFTNADALSIKEAPDGAAVRIGGIVRGTKTIKTKKGDLMGFATIEDLQGSVEVTVFSRLYATAGDLLAEDSAVLVQGQVQKDEQSVKLIAETIVPLAKAEEIWTSSVHMNLDVSRTNRPMLLNLREVLEKYPGSCKVFLHLRSPDRTEAKIELSGGLHLKAGIALRREVSEVLGYPAMQTRCNPI